MKFTNVIGLGVGLALGGGLIYGFFISEALRLLVVGLGAFILAVITIGGTALLINRQWIRTLEGHRTTHNHRYKVLPDFAGGIQAQPSGWDTIPRQHPEGLLPRPDVLPMWSAGDMQQQYSQDDEVVA
jgi:hypothetical protein